MENLKNKKWKYTTKYYVVLIGLFTLFQLAFYRMMIEKGDNISHMSLAMSILNEHYSGGYLIHMLAYPLYHIVVRIFSFMCLGDFYTAGICVLTLSNIIASVVMRHIVRSLCAHNTPASAFVLDTLSVAYLFFETLASPLTDGRIYAMQSGPNPWHNPTITFVRPLGLLALVMFVKVVIKVESGNDLKEYKRELLGFSVWATISSFAKPSFMMVFLPAMGIYVLFFWMKDFKGRMDDAMNLLFAAFPTLIVIIGQFVFCQFYNNGAVSPIRIQPGGFSEFSLFEIIKVCIATFPVPLLALILYRERIMLSDYVKVSYLALFFGVLEMFMLTNGPSGDFSWGYDLAVGILTPIVLCTCISITEGKWRRIPLFAIFGCQVLIGIYYVLKIYHTDGQYWF